MSHNPPTPPMTAIESETIKMMIEMNQKTGEIQFVLPDDIPAMKAIKILETVYTDTQVKLKNELERRKLLPLQEKHFEMAAAIKYSEIKTKKK